MSNTVWLLPDDIWKSLQNHGQFISGLELVNRLNAAMTEVDLEEMRRIGLYPAGDADTFKAGAEAVCDHLLDRIKEAQ